MKGKFKGIPFALIGIILAFGAVVDVPMVLLHQNNVQRLSNLETEQLNTKLQVRRLGNLLVTPTVTATPSASVSPTPAKVLQYRPAVTTRPATPSVQVK